MEQLYTKNCTTYTTKEVSVILNKPIYTILKWARNNQTLLEKSFCGKQVSYVWTEQTLNICKDFFDKTEKDYKQTKDICVQFQISSRTAITWAAENNVLFNKYNKKIFYYWTAEKIEEFSKYIENKKNTPRTRNKKNSDKLNTYYQRAYRAGKKGNLKEKEYYLQMARELAEKNKRID